MRSPAFRKRRCVIGADKVVRVINGSQSGWAVEAEHAFAKAIRARRRASLGRRFLRRCAECARLAVIDAAGARGAGAGHGVRDITLERSCQP